MYNEYYEALATAFENATGLLAPGKDDPMAREGDIELRNRAWVLFLAGRVSVRDVPLRSLANDPIPQPEAEADECDCVHCRQ